MLEKIIEALIDKANTAIADAAEVNLIVRRLPDLRQPLDRINERVDAIQASQQQNETEIKSIKEEYKAIRKELEKINTTLLATQEEIKKLPELLSIRQHVFDDLKGELSSTRYQLTVPLKKDVHHHHHFTWPIIVAVVLFVTNCLFLHLWIGAHNDTDKEKANDIKYRFLKTWDAPAAKQALNSVDSDYISNPDAFRKKTEEKELR